MAKKKKWIAATKKKMVKKGTVGALRKQLGAKEGKPIPKAKLRKAAKSKNPKTRKRAQWALNVQGKK